tara:strand:- start:309 stop:1136 length:828 start_codon:yes stop_codon:yes gene_type:complete
MKKVATLILNRNLPKVTDKLYDHINKYDGKFTDIFVIEAGSDKENLSSNTTWYADWPEAKRDGLRYARGMNYGLSMLFKENKFLKYDAFFLLTNDTELEDKSTIEVLIEIFNKHKRLGILSPCSHKWGEKLLLKGLNQTKYFWFIHNNSYFLRRDFIETIINKDKPDHINFLFDGNNFRGYCSESELIAKAYANDWAAGITSKVWSGENESYLLDKANEIKTENYKENLKLYVEEGKKWMLNKYGYNSKWSMNLYTKSFYDAFFQFHPEFSKYKI